MTIDNLIFHFAYGSNMDESRFNSRISPKGFRHYGKFHAELRNYVLCFNKQSSRDSKEGFANIVPSRDNIVEGVVYLVKANVLNALDGFEGVPDHYVRQNVFLSVANQGINAVAYIANPLKTRGQLMPSRDYLNHLLAGRDLLSSEYYNWLAGMRTL